MSLFWAAGRGDQAPILEPREALQTHRLRSPPVGTFATCRTFFFGPGLSLAIMNCVATRLTPRRSSHVCTATVRVHAHPAPGRGWHPRAPVRHAFSRATEGAPGRGPHEVPKQP